MKIITLIPIIMQMAVNHIHLPTDTVLYNAPLYKVHNNPQVEELLKKMEGIKVNPDGSITHQGGQLVKKIRLNGKDCGASDTIPKQLKNNLIEHRQVVNDYDEQAVIKSPNKHAGIIYKEDTIQFIARNYKVPKNSRVIQLLKIMEGFEVGADGAISFHRQLVDRIKINGKERPIDLTKAIKKLPANLVEIIEVIDDYGDAANNTFKNPGPEEILNIIIKKDESANFHKLKL